MKLKRHLETFNNALDLYPINPNLLRSGEVDTPEEEGVFMIKLKIAVIKSLIVGGYTVCANIAGGGVASIASPQIAQFLNQSPEALVVWVIVSFGLAFFGKLLAELGINK